MMIEMPIPQDIPVARRHPPQAWMNESEFVRGRRRETLNEFHHDFPILFLTPPGSAAIAARAPGRKQPQEQAAHAGAHNQQPER
jgi:hypothetical protein